VIAQLDVPEETSKAHVNDIQNGDVGISIADVAFSPEALIGKLILTDPESIIAPVVPFTAVYDMEPVKTRDTVFTVKPPE